MERHKIHVPNHQPVMDAYGRCFYSNIHVVNLTKKKQHFTGGPLLLEVPSVPWLNRHLVRGCSIAMFA